MMSTVEKDRAPPSKTVFILGAGASAEVELPVGEALTKPITNLVDIRFDRGNWISGDPLIVDALQNHVRKTSPSNPDINPYLHAGWRIRDAMPLAASIDNFLDGHREDKHVELVGKLAIVRSILQAEGSSRLYGDLAAGPDQLISLERVRGSWFSAFWQVLCNGCTADQFVDRARSVAFISFNYDRCIEQFLYHAARAYYGLSTNAAAEAIRQIRIYHPYGSVGPLPWQEPAKCVAYGGQVGAGELLELAGGIKTFTESTRADDQEVTAIREAASTVERIVFLGFAYHYQNMRLLWPTEKVGARTMYRWCYGTAHRISDSDTRAIVSEISNFAGINDNQVVLRNDLKCGDLFHEYQHSLSMIER